VFGSLDRFALALALFVFILADFRGAAFGHALQRAVVAYFVAWAVRSLWRWVLWPWFRASANARRMTPGEDLEVSGPTEGASEELAEAA